MYTCAPEFSIKSPHVAYHRNGGARVIGEECHVSHDSFCDPYSTVMHTTKVFHSSLIRSSATTSLIVGSTLEGAALIDSIVDGATIHRVELISVVVENCELQGPWFLTGIARIPCGIWHRAPRFIEIVGESAVPDHEIRAGITESTDGHALIACMRKPITEWLKAGPRLGRMLGWRSDQVREAADFFTMLLDCPMPTN